MRSRNEIERELSTVKRALAESVCNCETCKQNKEVLRGYQKGLRFCLENCHSFGGQCRIKSKKNQLSLVLRILVDWEKGFLDSLAWMLQEA